MVGWPCDQRGGVSLNSPAGSNSTPWQARRRLTLQYPHTHSFCKSAGVKTVAPMRVLKIQLGGGLLPDGWRVDCTPEGYMYSNFLLRISQDHHPSIIEKSLQVGNVWLRQLPRKQTWTRLRAVEGCQRPDPSIMHVPQLRSLSSQSILALPRFGSHDSVCRARCVPLLVSR